MSRVTTNPEGERESEIDQCTRSSLVVRCNLRCRLEQLPGRLNVLGMISRGRVKQRLPEDTAQETNDDGLSIVLRLRKMVGCERYCRVPGVCGYEPLDLRYD